MLSSSKGISQETAASSSATAYAILFTMASEFKCRPDGGDNGHQAVSHAYVLAVLVGFQHAESGVQVIVDVVDVEVEIQFSLLSCMDTEIGADVEAVVVGQLGVVGGLVEHRRGAVLVLDDMARQGDAVA